MKVLTRFNVEIYNEYSEKVSLENFVKMVLDSSNSKHNHARMVLENDPEFKNATEEYKIKNWLDKDGHSFYNGEFC